MATIKVELTSKDIDAISTSVVAKLKAEKEFAQPVVYTVNEVAQIVKLHKNTILRHINDGLLNATRTGKSFSITEKQLKEYLEKK